MAFYRDQVVPRLLHVAMGIDAVAPLRERVCAGLVGEVVETGFGSGSNVPFYPAAVRQVAAVEPSEVAWRLAGKRLADTPVAVRRAGLDGQRLPFEDESFDAALSTWTVCSIPDAGAALRELRRVLRPGGRLHFLEHGLAPEERVRRMQRRLVPLQKRLFGGCDFTKPVLELITDAGFVVEEADIFYQAGAPKFEGAASLGVSLKQ